MKAIARSLFTSTKALPGVADNLPKGQLIAFTRKIVDMIQIWEVLDPVISIEEEQLSPLTQSILRITSGNSGRSWFPPLPKR
jgi:hypothetical protein